MTDDRADKLARRDAAQKNAIAGWQRIVERVNQASDDGYDVLNPDVLADAMWAVAHAQISAGHSGYVEQCELLVREYAAEWKAIDQRFPRRIKGGQ